MKNIILIFAIILVSKPILSGQEPQEAIDKKVVIRPLAYGGKPPRGFAGRETMEYEVNPDPKGLFRNRMLAVGFLGDVPDGVGPTLKASLWGAASVAGRVKNNPLIDSSFLLKIKGRVDGPSAGALFTVSMLAMMQGDDVNPEVTMTGTILPDGSIGAVGGVRFKMEGAEEKGLKKVLVPEYLRIEIDFETGDVIDLSEHGKKLGIEVAFVSNIEEAYPHFTGKKLLVAGAGKALDEKTVVKLPDSLERLLKIRTMSRFKELNREIKNLKAGKMPKDINFDNPAIKFSIMRFFEFEMRKNFSEIQAAVAYMKENQWIVAFEKVNSAWLSINALLRWQKTEYDLLQKDDFIKKGGQQLMGRVFKHRDLLTGGDAGSPVEKAILDVRAFHDGLNIYTMLNVENAWVDYLDFQIAQLLRQPAGEERNDNLVEKEIEKLRMRAFQTLRILKMVSILENTGPDEPEEEVDLDLLAGAFAFRGAGDDEPRPLDKEKVEQWYLFGKTRNDVLLKNLESALGENKKKLLLEFDNRKAIALLEFNNEFKGLPVKNNFEGAVLMAKQEVEFAFAIIKEDVYGYQNAAFRGMLANARENARNAILHTEKLNYQMYGPRYDYLRAEGLRSGNSDDQLQALRLYMSAAAVCRLLSACVKDAE